MKKIGSKNFQVLSRNELRSISGGANVCVHQCSTDASCCPGDYCSSFSCHVSGYRYVTVRSCAFSGGGIE